MKKEKKKNSTPTNPPPALPPPLLPKLPSPPSPSTHISLFLQRGPRSARTPSPSTPLRPKRIRAQRRRTLLRRRLVVGETNGGGLVNDVPLAFFFFFFFWGLGLCISPGRRDRGRKAWIWRWCCLRFGLVWRGGRGGDSWVGARMSYVAPVMFVKQQ